jgi:hypothetical protein
MPSTAIPPRPDTAGRSSSGRGVAIAVLLIALIAHVLFSLGCIFVLLVGGTTGLQFGVVLLAAVTVGLALVWLVTAIISDRLPPNRALVVLIVPLADVLIAILLTTGTLGGSCSDRELAIIDGIAPYPGATTTFNYESSTGSCAASFDVQASPEDVLEHYRRELEGDGWVVVIEDVPTSDGVPVSAKDLSARRDVDSFTIAMESFPPDNTSAAIRVDAG